MTKFRFQALVQVEVDTETGKCRLIKGWSTLLGEGNRPKKKKKVLPNAILEVAETEFL